MDHLCDKLEQVKIKSPENIEGTSGVSLWKFDPNRVYILLLNNLVSWKMIGIFNSLNDVYHTSGNIMLILPEKYEICLIYTNVHKIINYRINHEYSYNVLVHVRKTHDKDKMDILYKHEHIEIIERTELLNYLTEYTKLININYDSNNLFLYEMNGNKIIIDNTKIAGYKLYNLRTVYKVELNVINSLDN